VFFVVFFFLLSIFSSVFIVIFINDLTVIVLLGCFTIICENVQNPIAMVILIDNNVVSNFFNVQILESSSRVSKVLCFENSVDALNYIAPLKAVLSKPIYVFININMPHINGWEFIERCLLLKGGQELLKIVLMSKEELDTEQEIKESRYSNIEVINPLRLTTSYVDELLNSVHQEFLRKVSM